MTLLSSTARSLNRRQTVTLSTLSRMAPAQQRVAMLQSHLSTSAPASAAIPAPGAPGPVVIFEAVHSLRKMTLNRPAVLNALNSEMVSLIQPQLKKWEESPLANVILFKGNGKSFCAGGDVATLALNLKEDETLWSKSSEFFKEEYAVDAYISRMTKPIVTFMTGNTLGGGVGLSVHAPFRIATESTKFAMPETGLGLFTDVGASFFLSRLDGQLGIYLGLTGDRLVGAGALLAGVATHYVPTERLEGLEARLAELDGSATHEDVNSAIEEYAADAAELKEALKSYVLVGDVRRAIDSIFAHKTVEQMVADLLALEKGTLNVSKIVAGGGAAGPELQKWAKVMRGKLEASSPTSLKLTLLAIRQGKELNIEEAFKADLRIATACCNPVVHPDFPIGVNHILLNKDPKKGRAPWNPPALEDVEFSHIKRVYFSNPPPFKNPPLPVLPPSSFRGTPYSQYPHAKYSLPTEADVQSHMKDAGSKTLTQADVVSSVVSAWNGKIGVKEKVEEVLARRCVVSPQGSLTWPSGRRD